MSSAANIWEALLKESSARAQLPEGTALIMGNSNCGKSSLVRKLCGGNSTSNSDESESIPDIIAYDSFVASDVDETITDNFSSTRIGVWSISEKTFKDAASLVLHPASIERLVLIVAVDLSQPETCCENLIKWLNIIKHHMEIFYSSILEPEVRVKRRRNLDYLSSVRQHHNLSDVKDNDLVYNYGVPLVVVGCKADLVHNDISNLRKHNETQRDLRELCLKVGAGLIYTSSGTGSNCNLLKKYMLHRLYYETMQMDLKVELNSSQLFIPAAVDTKEMISVLTGPSLLSPYQDFGIFDSQITQIVQNNDIPSNGEGIHDSAIVLEDEQTWLSTLYSAIDQSQSIANSVAASADTAGTQSTASSGEKSASIADKILAAGVQNSTATNAEAKPAKTSRRHSTLQSSAASSKAAPEDVKGFFESLMQK